jgi:hypothetical protein
MMLPQTAGGNNPGRPVDDTGDRTEAGEERANMLIKAFRLGPVLLLPVVFLWGKLCNQIGSWEAYDWWRGYPISGMIVAAVVWHLALIAVEKDKLNYSMYALGHFPIFLLVSFISYLHATRAPL